MKKINNSWGLFTSKSKAYLNRHANKMVDIINDTQDDFICDLSVRMRAVAEFLKAYSKLPHLKAGYDSGCEDTSVRESVWCFLLNNSRIDEDLLDQLWDEYYV